MCHRQVGLSIASLIWKLVCHGGDFQVRIKLDSSGPISKVHDVLSNRVLSLTSRRQSKAKVMDCNVWGVSWTPLNNNLKV